MRRNGRLVARRTRRSGVYKNILLNLQLNNIEFREIKWFSILQSEAVLFFSVFEVFAKNFQEI
jgi:hypothetical protein